MVIFSKILVNNVQIISNACNIYTFVHDGNLSYMCKNSLLLEGQSDQDYQLAK